MDLENVFKDIKKKFAPRKKIDFEELDTHFDVEPLSVMEEMIVMESIQDIEGAQYMEALKRHTLACAIKNINGVEVEEEIKYYDEDGAEKIKSKFLFMKDYLAKWPAPLVDSIFNAYSNMLQGLQKKMSEDIRFEKVLLSEEPEEEEPEKLRRIDETDTGLTETEKLEKKVKEEALNEEIRLAEQTQKK